jgi:hypothetical protein
VASVVLCDPTGTYGIKRNDTNAVVVPAGTPLAREGVGVYSYTFTEPAPGLTYTAYIKYTTVDGVTDSFPDVITGAAASGMTLAEARAIVLLAARDAVGDPAPYTPAEVDNAIKHVGNHFARTTRALRQVATVNLAAGDGAINAGGWAGFRPEMLLGAEVDGVETPIELTTWDRLRRLRISSPAKGAPTRLAFDTWTSGGVHPIPNQPYTLKVRWWAPFTAWTSGTESPDDVILNIPADWLTEILPLGPPAILQHNELTHAYATESYQKYLALAKTFVGAGGSGAKSLTRPRPTW